MEKMDFKRTANLVTLATDAIQARGVSALPMQSPLARWSPSRRLQRHLVQTVPQSLTLADHLDGSKDPAVCTLVRIKSADDLGHVRSGTAYNKDYGTRAGFFEKPRRKQFLEGPTN